MIQANDLRRGNVIKSIHVGAQTVCTITDKRINGTLIKYFEPIPLSPDILLKAGFERYNELDMADEHWKIKTNQHDFKVVKLHGEYIAEVYFQVAVPYVHVLQNLHKSLTNNELIIQL